MVTRALPGGFKVGPRIALLLQSVRTPLKQGATDREVLPPPSSKHSLKESDLRPLLAIQLTCVSLPNTFF